MEFYSHTLNWCKGEILEGRIILLFAVVLAIVATSYAIWGSTPYAKAAFWPLIINSAFALAMGSYLILTNQRRIITFAEEFKHDPIEFVAVEKERTESFIVWYPKTKKIVFGLMIAGMLCMILSGKPWVRSIGIGLMLFSLFVFIVDHFSEERALDYHQNIQEQLAN
jgi:membrane glycosyltransferase